MPSPRLAAAALCVADSDIVVGGSSAVLTDASPTPSTNFALPAASRAAAMSSTTGSPVMRAPIAASVPAIVTDETDAPPLRNCAPSSPTAAREAAAFFDVIVTAAFSSSRLAPLAKIPAELIQLANWLLACAVGAPSSRSGVTRPCSSPLIVRPALPSGGPPESVLGSEDSASRPCASSPRVAPTWPSPIASHDSPGSSLSACAPSGSGASSPPPAPAAPPAPSVSASSVSELGLGTSEMFAGRAPASRCSSPAAPSFAAPA